MDPVFDTRHLIVPEKGRITEILPSLLAVSTERVSELLHLGSVYVNKKRVLEDKELSAHSYVRVHCKPKRYDVSKVDWKSTVVFENEDFVLVDKPSGFPVPSAVDNVRETVMAQLQKALNQNLLITQRLDVLTSGLLVFAKTTEFQRAFNAKLANHETYKEYLARTSGGPELGIHTHYMKPAKGAPREVFALSNEGWKECRLRVLSVKSTVGPYFHTRIHLLTGRTHQIRAQMKALDCTLWGDKTYGSDIPESEFLLLSQVLRFNCPLKGTKFDFGPLRDIN